MMEKRPVYKLFFVFLSLLFFNGCATYKFHKGQPPRDNGYLVSRAGYTIAEYTLGYNDSLPDLSIARQRFKRRKGMVEHYYKRMGFIENRFKQFIMDPPYFLGEFIAGFFKLPFLAVQDYEYEKNVNYQRRLDEFEKMQDEKEAARINKLKGELYSYIDKDLERELNSNLKVSLSKVQAPPVEVVEQKNIPSQSQPQQEPKAKVVEDNNKLPVKDVSPQKEEGIFAKIKCKPSQGLSPLRVYFWGGQSQSSYGRVISYEWDFGDGVKSNKRDTENVYWSGTFGSRFFIATLTVKDDKGNTATADTQIEVINK